MTETQATPTIRWSAELSIGDEIESRRDGKLVERGTVSRALPSVGMIWIVCARTGTHKLVDLEASEIVRVSAARNPGLPGLVQRRAKAADCPSGCGSALRNYAKRRG